MELIRNALWVVMLLLFFGGAVTYAFDRHLGLSLLKKAGVLLIVVLIGPSLISTAIHEIPAPILILLGAALSLAAYHSLTGHTKAAKHGHGVSHAERHPLVPVEHGEEQGEEHE